MQSLDVRSPEMVHGGPMNARYAHQKSGGLNQSPPIYIEGLPSGVRSISVMLVDRNADDFVHWLIVDLPPQTTRLAEGASGGELPGAAREVYNSAGSLGYFGPNPPPRSGEHRYEIVAYGLDIDSLEVADHVDAAAFDAAAREHAVARGSEYWVFENR